MGGGGGVEGNGVEKGRGGFEVFIFILSPPGSATSFNHVKFCRTMIIAPVAEVLLAGGGRDGKRREGKEKEGKMMRRGK